MKLYRLTILGYSSNIEKGVWAERMLCTDGAYQFLTESEVVATYPIAKTIITNVETKEAYEERKKREDSAQQTFGRVKK